MTKNFFLFFATNIIIETPLFKEKFRGNTINLNKLQTWKMGTNTTHVSGEVDATADCMLAFI